MEHDEAQNLATSVGLAKLEAKHVKLLAESIKAARALAEALPKDLHWSEEPAIVFRVASSKANTGRKP